MTDGRPSVPRSGMRLCTVVGWPQVADEGSQFQLAGSQLQVATSRNPKR